MHIVKKAKCLNFAALSIWLTLAPISATAAAYQWEGQRTGYSSGYPIDVCRAEIITTESDPARGRTVLADTIKVHTIYYDWFNGQPRAIASCAFDFLVTSALAHGIEQRLSNSGEYAALRRGDGCDGVKTYNLVTGVCGQEKEQGVPDQFACVGNPISVKSGNKYQKETDYSDGALEVSRHYNSLDGLWRSVFSDVVKTSGNNFYVSRADGSNSSYTASGDSIIPDVRGSGDLKRTSGGWEYNSPIGEVLEFDTTGRLIKYVSRSSRVYAISYDNLTLKVSVNTRGAKSLLLTLDAQGQPLRAQVGDVTLVYSYEDYRLASVSKQAGGIIQVRKFLYEKDDKKLLTGIIDERGVRFATWDYDIQGRAISSQHAGGAGLTHVEYLDGASTVTNELGKKTTYKYQQYLGISRITAIIGEPSPNCPASNSSYTYNAYGQLETVTDAKGLITFFMYNDRGLEIARTEARWTPLERFTYTDWHPDRALPIRVIASGRVTEYNYDDEGRLLSQKTTPEQISAPN